MFTVAVAGAKRLSPLPGGCARRWHFGPHEHTAQGEDLFRRVDAYVKNFQCIFLCLPHLFPSVSIR